MKTHLTFIKIGGGEVIAPTKTAVTHEIIDDVTLPTKYFGNMLTYDDGTWVILTDAVAEENARWNNGEITVDFNLIGDRPVGRTPTESRIVQVAALAFDEIGVELDELGISSTDSNVPMALNIPAITIAGGGNGGGAHSPGEWFIPINTHVGPQTALLVMLSLVGIDGVAEPLLEEMGD